MGQATGSETIEERRKAERHLYVIDATVIFDAGEFRAELLNVNSSGIGISWFEGNGAIPDDTPARLECEHPWLTQQPLSGFIKGYHPDHAYQPNKRSVWLKTNEDCTSSIEQLIQNCTNGLDAPEGCSPGLRRAWNTLRPEERVLVQDYVRDLKASGSNGQKVADNLIKDRNCPGHRLRNLLEVLIKELVDGKNKGAAPFDILIKAFAIYEEQYSIPDAERDRPITWV